MPTEIEQLYREQRAGLVRLVERELHDHHDAEDVVQTAFLDAQRAIERGTIPRNPRAWLATIALNAARRLRRRRLNAEPLEEYAVQEAMGMSEIRAALANLPSEQRAAVLYRDVLGLSYSETADQMGTSVNAVTMLLHRGRQRLRQTLGVTTASIGLGRWLKRAGVPQVAAAKGAAAVVVAAGLATAGVVSAHEAAPIGAADMPPMQSAAPTAGGRQPPGSAVALDPARRHSKAPAPSPSPSPAPESTHGSMQEAPGSSAPTSLLRLPTVSLPTVSIPTVPTTVAVSTPIATVTVSTPTATTVAVTTPIVTVTVPLP